MSNFTFVDFEEIYEGARIAVEGESSESWERFKREFELSSNAPNRFPTFPDTEPRRLWAEVKAQHEEFLITLLAFGFCHFNNQRSGALLICLLLSTLGYACLAWPSILVFKEIVQSSF